MNITRLLSLSFLLTAGNLAAQGSVPVDPVRQAQAPGADAGAIRLAAAHWIGAFLDSGEWYAASYTSKDRVLAPWTLSAAVKGDTILWLTTDPNPINKGFRSIPVPLANRSAKEAGILAAALKAKVGTSADSIWCEGGNCHGTMSTLIQLGNPVVSGTEAVIVFSLLNRSPLSPHLPGRTIRLAVYLERGANGWVVQSARNATQPTMIGVKWNIGDPSPFDTKKQGTGN